MRDTEVEVTYYELEDYEETVTMSELQEVEEEVEVRTCFCSLEQCFVLWYAQLHWSLICGFVHLAMIVALLRRVNSAAHQPYEPARAAVGAEPRPCSLPLLLVLPCCATSSPLLCNALRQRKIVGGAGDGDGEGEGGVAGGQGAHGRGVDQRGVS
jgi:hypothetical protein